MHFIKCLENEPSEMYALVMFHEEGGNLGNLCIWKVCIKLVGDQDVESGGRGQPLTLLKTM